MGLSKKYLSTNTKPVPFSVTRLAEALKEQLPEAIFAYILGSSALSSVVNPYSDLDLALYLHDKPSLSLFAKVQEIVEECVGPVRCDMGILNNAEPVYRFESISGKLLFTRDMETWVRFYSLTCREYESQMIHYERQLRYRMEVHG